jgi:hypothetical protein
VAIVEMSALLPVACLHARTRSHQRRGHQNAVISDAVIGTPEQTSAISDAVVVVGMSALLPVAFRADAVIGDAVVAD